MTQVEKAFVAFRNQAEKIYPLVDNVVQKGMELYTGGRCAFIYSNQGDNMLRAEVINENNEVYYTCTEDVHVVMFAIFRVFSLIINEKKAEEMSYAILERSFEAVLIDQIGMAIVLFLQEASQWEDTKI